MTTYFDDKSFKFLRGLARHNERGWFQDHKAEYDEHLRLPFLRLIGDLQAPLAEISTHYRADPKPVGGSLFRIHRDTRFANDKTPYKTHAGARFFHERHREVEAPSFYLHIQPGNCFVGAGLWHPETATLRRIRDFLIENPEAWKRAVHAPAFRRLFELGGESLTRPPRGYPADHELIEDLKRKSFTCWRALDDETVLGPRLKTTVADNLRAAAPLVDYLCAALNLDF